MKNILTKILLALCMFAMLFSLPGCGIINYMLFDEETTQSVTVSNVPAQSVVKEEADKEENAPDTSKLPQSAPSQNSQNNGGNTTIDQTITGPSAELQLNSSLASLIDGTNQDVISQYSTNAGMSIFWGGVPAAAYSFPDSGHAMIFFFDTEDFERMYDAFDQAGGVDSNENLWPNDYPLLGIVLYGTIISELFSTSQPVTYNMLSSNFNDMPQLQFTTNESERIPAGVPYLSYNIGDGRVLEMEFTEQDGEYLLDTVIITHTTSNLDTFMLSM